MKPVVCLLLALFAAACQDGRAALSATPTKAETRALLLNKSFDELDERYGAVQRAYADGDVSDVELRNAFRALEDPDLALMNSYLRWVRHSPKSYVAHLARGIFFTRLAGKTRGGEFASETSERQFEGMRSAHRLAAEEFKLSLALESKPLLTYLHSIDIAVNFGDVDPPRELLDKSIAIDARNFVVRAKYMGAITTAWGGSTAQMRKFLKECETAGLSADQMKVLEANVAADEAWVYRYRDNNAPAAVAAYLRAAELVPQRDCGSCSYLGWAAGLSSSSQDFKTALDLYSRVLAQDSRNVDALNGRGATYLRMKEGKLAAADFLQTAEQGDAYGQEMLGKMLLVGTAIPEDRARAIEWLSKAAEQGNLSAGEALAAAMNKNSIILPAPGSNL